jgi:hypothetical protein
MISLGMIGHFGTDPLWACVKVDDYCDTSSAGILTRIKSLETSVEHIFTTARNSGLLFLSCEDE